MWKWGGRSHCWLWALVTLLQPSFDLATQASAGMWLWYWQETIWPLDHCQSFDYK